MTCSKLVVHRKHFCANQSDLICSQEPGPPNAPAQNPCCHYCVCIFARFFPHLDSSIFYKYKIDLDAGCNLKFVMHHELRQALSFYDSGCLKITSQQWHGLDFCWSFYLSSMNIVTFIINEYCLLILLHLALF